MAKLVSPRLFLLSWALAALPAAAAWMPTNGPIGKPVVALVADSTDLYLGTEDGLYRSRDGAASWQRLSVETGSQLRTCLAVKGGEIFLGTFGGVYRRGAEGGAWAKVNGGLEDTTVQALAFAGDAILAGTGRQGHLYRSTDHGSRWTRLNPAVRMGAMLQITVDGPRIHAATSEGIQFSPDDGATWTRLLPAADDDEIRNVFRTETYLFARTRENLYRSGDGGLKWDRITPPGLPTLFPEFRSFFAEGARLYATSHILGLFRSTDHGTTWVRDTVHFHYRQNWGSNYLFFRYGQDLFSGGGDGVHRSRDHGLTWTSANTGIGGGVVSHMVGLGPGRILAAKGSVYFDTEDNGATWTRNPSDKAGRNITRFARLGRLVFTASGQGVYRSADAGRSWDSLPGDWGQQTLWNMEALGGLLYLPSGGGVYRSGDSGLTWKLTQGLGAARADELALDEGGRLFAGTIDGVYSLQGDLWSPVAGGLRGEYLLDLEAAGPALLATTFKGGILRSLDRGATWSRVLDSAKAGWVRELHGSGNRVYAAADSGIFVSGDQGGHWTAFDGAGLPGRKVAWTMLIHEDSLFVNFEWEGVWKRALSESGPVALAPGRPGRARSGRPEAGRISAGRLGFPREPGKRERYDAGGKRLPLP